MQKSSIQYILKLSIPIFFANLAVPMVGIIDTALMGNYVGLYGFSELPMIKTKHYDMSFKLGCGAGYTSKIYDPIYNPKNVAVSTHLNAMMCFAIKSTYRFGPHAINTALDISHFSNAAFKVPPLLISVG